MAAGPVAAVFAGAGPPWAVQKLLRSTEFLVTTGLLAGVLLGGAVVLYVIDIWRKRQASADRESADSLMSFRALHERGELTDTEYQEIKARLAGKLKAGGRPAVPGPPAGPAGAKPADGANPAGGDAGLPSGGPTG